MFVYHFFYFAILYVAVTVRFEALGVANAAVCLNKFRRMKLSCCCVFWFCYDVHNTECALSILFVHSMFMYIALL